MRVAVAAQALSRVRLSVTPWTAAHQASLSFTVSRSLLKLMCIEPMMPSDHLTLCHPLLLLPSVFPSIRVFSSGSALHIRWPKYWNSPLSSALLINIQGLFPLGLTGPIPCCSRDSQKSSPAPPFKSINSLVFSLLYGPTLTSIHDCWKTMALTMRTFVSKVMPAF